MNIVRENINFERGQDPKKSMDLGHGRIPKYEEIFWVYSYEESRMIKVKSLEERPGWNWSKEEGYYWSLKVEVLDVEYKTNHNYALGDYEYAKKQEELDGFTEWYINEY